MPPAQFQEPDYDLATEAFKQQDSDYESVSRPQSGNLTCLLDRNKLDTVCLPRAPHCCDFLFVMQLMLRDYGYECDYYCY